MLLPFRDAVIADFEFRVVPGCAPQIRCAVFRSVNTGRELRLDRDQLLAMRRPPLDLEQDVLVSYYAPAEISCFLELGWPLPRVVDLYVEHRVLTNGLLPRRQRVKGSESGKSIRGGNSLLNALAIRGLAHIDADEKDRGRNLILAEPEPSPAQMAEMVSYCATDVDGAEALFRYMVERRQIDWPRALWRGRYAAAAARMERKGPPIDVALHSRLAPNWPGLRHALIETVNRDFDVFDENDTFKADRFAAYVLRHNLPWPKHPSGALQLDTDTFDDMTRFHPQLRPLYELRSSLGEMRLTGLAIGPDGRNRCPLWIFQTITGRNAPSNSAFIFGPARWMRGLIKPRPGFALAYVDWKSQEIAIAAALSGDERLLAAYRSGDIYMAFARDAGLVPIDATKQTHPHIREMCKTLLLGLGYGMAAPSIADRAGISVAEACNLLRLHRQAYPRFWQWVQDIITGALFERRMRTKFGWSRCITDNPNVRSIQNWMAQSHGAEMMRAAAIAATEVGLGICCPIHDAFLLEAPVNNFESDVAALRAIMRATGTAVIGVPVETDVKTIMPPDRYMDDRGAEMWTKVMTLLAAAEHKAAA